MDKKELGQWGEDAAQRHLQAAGCRILARNYRMKCGEIDLIAEEKGCIVFVEVKTRSSLAFGSPAEAVGFRKQQKIIRTAKFYLQSCAREEFPCRFDVLEVYKRQTDAQVRWIKGAFGVS